MQEKLTERVKEIQILAILFLNLFKAFSEFLSDDFQLSEKDSLNKLIKKKNR